MTTMVKICGLTDASAVDAAIAAGADAVGFVFASSVRKISPSHARKISAAVPEGILKVAVMMHPDDDYWQELQETFRPDVLQTDASDFDYLDVAASVRRWPVWREGQALGKLSGEFVYEGIKSGQGETVDWKRASQISASGRMILAGGLSSDNVAEAVSLVRPWGVDVSSAVESSPGRKDPEKIRQFIGAVRAASKL